MIKKLLFALLFALPTLAMSAADPEVSFDFTSADNFGNPSISTDKEYTINYSKDGVTGSFKVSGSTNCKFNSGYFIFGKKDAYVSLPSFNFDVEKIVVTCNSGGSKDTKMNIFVGTTAASTETTGSKSTNTYNINSSYKTAGTIYTLKVTSSHNAQITKIEVYKVSGSTSPSDPENPIETVGDGTLTNPYTIDDIIALNINNSNTKAWVKGYILGYATSATKLSAANKAEDTNIALGKSADAETFIPVAIPSELRSDLGVKTNPDNISKEVLVFGSLETYFSTAGVKSTSAYRWVDFKLSDDADFSLVDSQWFADASYTRTVTNTDTWHAICLPFAVSDWSTFASEVIELTSAGKDENGHYLEFDDVTANGLNANTPYLFKPKATTITIEEKDATIYASTSETSKTVSGYTLTGNYAKIDKMATNGDYALSGGNFMRAKDDDAILKPFRAYLTISNATGAPARFNIRVNGEETTGVESIAVDAAADNVYYNLQGQRVSKPANGLYIINGKKVFVK